MPVFFITADQVSNGTVSISGKLCDHLRASLRVRPGERIWVGDEHRRRYLVDVTHADRRMVRGSVVEQRLGPPLSAPRLVIGQSLLKGERMDWAVQKLTELGAATIVPLVSEQTVVRPRQDRVGSQQERWQRIAVEAAQQSERWEVPEVRRPCPAGDFFTSPEQAAVRLLLSERDEGQSLRSIPLPSSPSDAILLAIGPEGGWRDEEAEAARAHGFIPVTLGERILRSETATLAAISVIQSRLGELG